MRNTLEDFIGKSFNKIDVTDESVIFHIDDKPVLMLQHIQDCCERVYLEDVVGDINNILNTPIVSFTKDTSDVEEDATGASMWTFYNISTIRGDVTLRWVGSSNGFYSMSVNVFVYNNDKGAFEYKYY